ncbi:MAG: hypothetical protein ACD_80C00131G0014 [uncultured bacterium (gcode 4)]|uniref:Uncharacterized protein n=1 Tax=uncultured bacterium (gcode 4) TaxID=1234023 RepID=K1XIH6_9BACT|nr:MAG: hypothetical protein ACD_80C00131G0014 [uncultured bacterium (gcode 4)]
MWKTLDFSEAHTYRKKSSTYANRILTILEFLMILQSYPIEFLENINTLKILPLEWIINTAQDYKIV